MNISLKKWCEINRRYEILKEWGGLYFTDKRDLNPSNILHSSSEYAYWICSRCGDRILYRINERIEMDILICPTCVKRAETNAHRITSPYTDHVQLVRLLHSSIPEQYIYFYLKKLFPDIESLKVFDWLGRRSIDIFIPTLKLGIEYDGSYWHLKKEDEDLCKDELCSAHGVSLIRIREGELSISTTRSKIIYYKHDRDYLNIGIPINEVLEFINYTRHMDLTLSVNPVRDMDDILLSIRKQYHEKTIAYKWPELFDYWDIEKNNGIKSEYVNINEKRYLHMKCPVCTKKFTIKPICHIGCRAMPVKCRCGWTKENQSSYTRYAINFYIEHGHLVINDDTLFGRRIYDWLFYVKDTQHDATLKEFLHNGIDLMNMDIG